MLSSGALERHIQRKLIPCYAARYHVMVGAIQEFLEPLGVRITTGKPYTTSPSLVNGSSKHDEAKTSEVEIQTAGGFFLLITLPKGFIPTDALAKTALADHELKFAYGKMFEVKGDVTSSQRSKMGYGDTIRLCWAYHEEALIVEGIKRLRDVLLNNKIDSSTVA